MREASASTEAVGAGLLYEIRRTKARGRGLFAVTRIPADTCVLRCAVIVFGGAQLGIMSRSAVADYTFRWSDDGRYSCVVLGDISLCNHAEAPNVRVDAVRAEEVMGLFALRDIPLGDELLLRYRRPLWFTPR
jgi:SET domain-containing protein